MLKLRQARVYGNCSPFSTYSVKGPNSVDPKAKHEVDGGGRYSRFFHILFGYDNPFGWGTFVRLSPYPLKEKP